jgi:glucokinase
MTPSVSRSSAEERGSQLNVLALDLGGTHLRTAVVTPAGRLHARRMVRTPRANAEQVLAACLDQLRESRAAALAEGLRAGVLTISAPGPLDPSRGVLIDPPNLDASLWDFPLGPRLAAELELPALLERDTQVAALGEGHFGRARGLSDFVYLTISTGVGGAVVSDGRLLRGPDGVAGELGHLQVAMDGPGCGCGGLGHLEAFSSGTGISAAARRAYAAGQVRPGTPLAELFAARGTDDLAGVDVAAAEEQGDQLAGEIMELARRAFAGALVSIVDVFNPQRVIVGGGVATGQGERLLGPARERVQQEAFRAQARRVEIVAAGLGDDVGLLGGVGLAELPPLDPPITSRAATDDGEPGQAAQRGAGDPGPQRAGHLTLTAPPGNGQHRVDEHEHIGAYVRG